MTESAFYPAEIGQACNRKETTIRYDGRPDGRSGRWDIETTDTFHGHYLEDFKVNAIYTSNREGNWFEIERRR